MSCEEYRDVFGDTTDSMPYSSGGQSSCRYPVLSHLIPTPGIIEESSTAICLLWIIKLHLQIEWRVHPNSNGSILPFNERSFELTPNRHSTQFLKFPKRNYKTKQTHQTSALVLRYAFCPTYAFELHQDF